MRITKHAIKEPNTSVFNLIEYSIIKKQHNAKQKILSKIFIDLKPSQLIKNDWKKACPPKVSLPIELSELP